MRKGIATVSVSGVLTEKLDAVAAAGFDGVEIFDNDLIASPLSPRDIAARCADLGVAIDLYQPVRDVQGVPPERFPAVLHRLRSKLAVAAELGAPCVLVCSHAGEDALADPDLTAEQLHRAGELAAGHGVTIAFEALAWGRHIDRVGQAWDAVRRAGHPAVTLAVDTFHMLARGDGAAALTGIPGDRIGFVQVADAPLLDMNLLEWSRHHRCFPGQGTLDVADVVAGALRAGYRGPLSIEVFSDVVRETDPFVTAWDAMRSLVFLEDQLATMTPVGRSELVAAPAPARRADFGFVEIACPPGDPVVPTLLSGLGFAEFGRHRSKPVTWWRNGGAHVVVNEGDPGTTLHAAAFGLVAPPVAAVAQRAAAMLWPAVETTRGAGEAVLPGITSPSGVHVFVSDAPGGSDDWQRDFTPLPPAPAASSSVPPGDWSGIDHVGVAVPPDRLNEEIGFFRTVFDLSPAAVEEFMEPHGRLRSRALRPRNGNVRVVLNVMDTAADRPHPVGITQVAFACRDVVATVGALRARGVELMPVPDNYYVDLQARFALPSDVLELLRRNGVLYDRAGDGEFLHAYTPVLATGFYVELLERRNGYPGYGSSNTHVRLAVQEAGWARSPWPPQATRRPSETAAAPG